MLIAAAGKNRETLDRKSLRDRGSDVVCGTKTPTLSFRAIGVLISIRVLTSVFC